MITTAALVWSLLPTGTSGHGFVPPILFVSPISPKPNVEWKDYKARCLRKRKVAEEFNVRRAVI